MTNVQNPGQRGNLNLPIACTSNICETLKTVRVCDMEFCFVNTCKLVMDLHRGVWLFYHEVTIGIK